MLTRRFVLSGLIAAPAIVTIDKLMPLRGIKWDPLVTLCSSRWPSQWWYTGALSTIDPIVSQMRGWGFAPFCYFLDDRGVTTKWLIS